jgi:hypothetical protein
MISLPVRPLCRIAETNAHSGKASCQGGMRRKMSIYGVAERSAATGRASDRGAGDGELRADGLRSALGSCGWGIAAGANSASAGTRDEAVSRAAVLEIREPDRTASSWARPCPWESGRSGCARTWRAASAIMSAVRERSFLGEEVGEAVHRTACSWIRWAHCPR